MASVPPLVLVLTKPPPPRDPTILEVMVMMRFFMRYGSGINPGPNLLAYQLTDMPDSVNAYWFWMHLRDS